MKKLLPLLATCFLFSDLIAQENIIKINALSLALTNVSLQYEHALSGNSSVALGLSYLPERGLPGMVTKKDDSKNAEDFKFSGFALTPEYRYYFKGNAPEGLYLAGYFRYAKYTTDKFSFDYDKANGTKGTIDMSGDYTTAVVGVMLGSQWALGENWALDWWIIGAGFGKFEGSYTADGAFSDQDQVDIKKEVESIDTPGADVKVSTSSTQTEITFKPSIPAIRGFGLCLGYRF